jgi:multiple sugar transport system ATP-binding protein
VQLGSGPWRGSVAHVERLGEHGYVYLALAGVDGPPLLARIGDEAVAVGDELALDLPPHRLHVFRADGAALAPRG